MLLLALAGFTCVEAFALRLDCEGQPTLAITNIKTEVKICRIRSCPPSI